MDDVDGLSEVPRAGLGFPRGGHRAPARGRRSRRAGLVAAAVVVLLAVVSQLLLPGIAARQLRDRLARYGRVLEVRVDAFPAIELLWHHADSVVVRMATYRSQPSRLAGLVGEVADTGSLDAFARELYTGLVVLRDATLRKRGDRLTGSATVSESDLRSAIPILESVQPVASGDGQLVLQGVASLLGLRATVDATVMARDGALVVTPDVPFGALATITLFSSPSIDVEAVGASPAPGGFTVTARARVK